MILIHIYISTNIQVRNEIMPTCGNVQKWTYFGVGCCLYTEIGISTLWYITMIYLVDIFVSSPKCSLSDDYLSEAADHIVYSNIMKNSIQISIKIKMRILTTSRHGCEMRSLLYIIYWTLRYPFAKSTSKLLTRKFWKLDLYTFYY